MALVARANAAFAQVLDDEYFLVVRYEVRVEKGSLSVASLKPAYALALVDAHPTEGSTIVACVHFAVLTSEGLRPGPARVALLRLS